LFSPNFTFNISYPSSSVPVNINSGYYKSTESNVNITPSAYKPLDFNETSDVNDIILASTSLVDQAIFYIVQSEGQLILADNKNYLIDFTDDTQDPTNKNQKINLGENTTLFVKYPQPSDGSFYVFLTELSLKKNNTICFLSGKVDLRDCYITNPYTGDDFLTILSQDTIISYGNYNTYFSIYSLKTINFWFANKEICNGLYANESIFFHAEKSSDKMFFDLFVDYEITSFGVFAYESITATNPVNITNGFYGSFSNSYVGDIRGTKKDLHIIGALRSLQRLRDTLISETGPLPKDDIYLASEDHCSHYGSYTSMPPNSLSQTFFPHIHYTTCNPTAVITDKVLRFDALGNPDAKFYLEFDDVIFQRTRFVLLNKASASNIFLRIKGSVGFANCPEVNGIVLSTGDVNLNYVNSFTGRLYSLTGSVNFIGSVIITPDRPLPCFLKGTTIQTEKGFVAVEDLKVGDRLVVSGKIIEGRANLSRSVYKKIKWIGSFRETDNKKTPPVEITQDAFGPNAPFVPLLLSPNHRLIFRKGIKCAKEAVDGETVILRPDILNPEYFHVEMEDHCVLNANGVLVESYEEMSSKDVNFKKVPLVLI